MITCLQRLPVRTAFAAISVMWGTCAVADEIPDLASLGKIVLKNESLYANFAVETTTFHWYDTVNQETPVSHMRRVVQWQDRFFESQYWNGQSGKVDRAAYHFVWCNGKAMTVYSPPDRVERFTGDFTPPAYFQPYSIVLSSLGYNGTLSSFLKQGEKQSLDEMSIEMTGVGKEGEFRTLNVLGSRRLPGSRFAKTISLRLAIDHGYLPSWGEHCAGEDGECHSRIVAEVPAFDVFKNGSSLMREIRVTRGEDRATDTLASRDVVEMRGTLLTQTPADDVFEPTEFLGNPKVFDHENRKTVRERLYHPPAPKKIKPWPPIVNWLVINAAALCGLTVFRVLNLARFMVRRQLARSL